MVKDRAKIRSWLQAGKANPNNTHVIIVSNTDDGTDFPIYVITGKQVQEIINTYNGKLTTVVSEVYDLLFDIEKQLSQHRSWNI